MSNISNLSRGLKNIHIDSQRNTSQQQQQAQQQQQQQQQEQPYHSRLKKFFQNPPLEGFTLFSHRSAPNGFKIAIVLSELEYEYNTIFLDFNNGEQKSPDFVRINPNARVPALMDHSNGTNIWESGSILLYLVNKKMQENGGVASEIWSDNLAEQSAITSWLFFQTSGHSPMIGQALHFKFFHQVPVPSAVERYVDEVRRVYGVVEMELAEKREALIMELDYENAQAYSSGLTPLSQSRYFDYPIWLVGERCTLADLSFIPWNNVVDRIGIDLKVEFPEVFKWTRHMMRRAGVVKALRVEPSNQ